MIRVAPSLKTGLKIADFVGVKQRYFLENISHPVDIGITEKYKLTKAKEYDYHVHCANI